MAKKTLLKVAFRLEFGNVWVNVEILLSRQWWNKQRVTVNIIKRD